MGLMLLFYLMTGFHSKYIYSLLCVRNDIVQYYSNSEPDY